MISLLTFRSHFNGRDQVVEMVKVAEGGQWRVAALPPPEHRARMDVDPFEGAVARARARLRQAQR